MNKKRFIIVPVLGFLLNGCAAKEKTVSLPSNPVATTSPQNLPLTLPEPQPTKIPSPNPSETPSVLPSAITKLSPQYLPYGVTEASGSKLFKIHTLDGEKIVWQNLQGNLNIFQDGKQFKEFPINPSLKKTTFASGKWNAGGKSFFVFREEGPTGNPDYENPVNSRMLSFEGERAIQNKSFSKFQIHSVSLNESGQGYILLSDEYPQPGISDGLGKPTNIYYAKVNEYIADEPQLLHQSSLVSQSGTRNTLDSFIDEKGSGFFIYRGARGKLILHRFTQLSVDPMPQIIDSVDGYDFHLIRTEKGFVLAYFHEKSTQVGNRVVTQYLSLHPIKDYQFDGQHFNHELTHRLNRSERKVFVNADGKGLLVGLQHDQSAKKDSLYIQELNQFNLGELKRYDYPSYFTLYDFNIALDKNGNGQLFFEDVKCQAVDCNSTNFELGKTPLQVSYLKLKDFSLQANAQASE